MYYYVVILVGLIVLVTTSGIVVNGIMQQILKNEIDAVIADEETEGKISEATKKRRIKVGTIIGKCENVIILCFIVLNAYTAMALVVTAKTIVRKEEIEKNSMYFLAGTLINVSYSVLIGFIVKLIIKDFVK